MKKKHENIIVNMWANAMTTDQWDIVPKYNPNVWEVGF